MQRFFNIIFSNYKKDFNEKVKSKIENLLKQKILSSKIYKKNNKNKKCLKLDVKILLLWIEELNLGWIIVEFTLASGVKRVNYDICRDIMIRPTSEARESRWPE